jgi:hypothetical protein
VRRTCCATPSLFEFGALVLHGIPTTRSHPWYLQSKQQQRRKCLSRVFPDRKTSCSQGLPWRKRWVCLSLSSHHSQHPPPQGVEVNRNDHHILHCTLTSPLSPEPPNPAQLAPSHAGARIRTSTRTRASFTAMFCFITHSPPPPHPTSLARSLHAHARPDIVKAPRPERHSLLVTHDPSQDDGQDSRSQGAGE